MIEKPFSAADDFALKHWNIIVEIIQQQQPNVSLATSQQAFAEAVWFKAFEAGYQKGLEALTDTNRPDELLTLTTNAQSELSHARDCLVMSKSASLLQSMYELLSIKDRQTLGFSMLAKRAIVSRQKPALKLVARSESHR